MKKIIFFLSALALLSLSACQQRSLDLDYAGKEINFTASVGAFTKATATAFEEGDKVGLTTTGHISLANLPLTQTEGVLASADKIYWGMDQKNTDTTTFVAYYPYDENMVVDDAFDLDIPVDQSASAATDLLWAKKESAPKDGDVHLEFSHLLAKLSVSITDSMQTDGYSFADEVTVKGVKMASVANLSAGTIALKEEAEALTLTPAYLGESTDGDKLFSALLPAQTAELEIFVKIKTGTGEADVKTVRYTAANALTFTAGKQIKANIVLAEDEVSFTSEVIDWTDETAVLNPETPDVSKPVWRVFFQGNDYPMAETDEENVVYCRLAYKPGTGGIAVFSELGWFCSAIPDFSAVLTPDVPVEIPLTHRSGHWSSFEAGKDYFREIDLWLNTVSKKLTVQMVPFDWDSLEWEDLGAGRFLDGFIGSQFENYAAREMDVNIEKADGYLRIKNPYENWPYANSEKMSYRDGGALLLDVTDPSNPVLAYSFTGLTDSNNAWGDLAVQSYSGFAPWNHIDYNVEQGYVHFTGEMHMTTESGVDTGTNFRGESVITLPGGTRPVILAPQIDGIWNYETDGNWYWKVHVYMGLDAAKARLLWINEFVSDTDIQNVYVPAMEAGTTGDEIEVVPGSWSMQTLLIGPVPPSGPNTFVLVVQNQDQSVSKFASRY